MRCTIDGRDYVVDRSVPVYDFAVVQGVPGGFGQRFAPRKMRSQQAMASGPLNRMTAMAPPEAVAGATMVSVDVFIGRRLSADRDPEPLAFPQLVGVFQLVQLHDLCRSGSVTAGDRTQRIASLDRVGGVCGGGVREFLLSMLAGLMYSFR